MPSVLTVSPVNFCKHVERRVRTAKYTYMEAILEVCEEHGIEPDSIASLLSQPIKEKIQQEAEDLNLLPKSGRLPV